MKDDPRTIGPLSIPSDILKVIVFILGIKALVFLFGGYGYQVIANKPIDSFYGYFRVWFHWDAIHYVNLAQDGYRYAFERLPWLITFFPLYPGTIRLASFVTGGDCFIASLLVSGVASLAAGVLLYRLVKLDESAGIAFRTVLFLFIFPTAFYLHIGTTESLFIALVAGAFLAARQNQWWLAGVLGFFITMTRANGLLIIPVLAVEAFLQFRQEKKWQNQWLWILTACGGLLVYLLINKMITGDPFGFLHYKEEKFHQQIDWPWVFVGGLIKSISWRNPHEMIIVSIHNLVVVALVLAATVISAFKLRPSYTVWIGLNLLLITSTKFTGAMPRYALAYFPLFILLAKLKPHGLPSKFLQVWFLWSMALLMCLFCRGWYAH